jgi:hypothetical protein
VMLCGAKEKRTRFLTCRVPVQSYHLTVWTDTAMSAFGKTACVRVLHTENVKLEENLQKNNFP